MAARFPTVPLAAKRKGGGGRGVGGANGTANLNGSGGGGGDEFEVRAFAGCHDCPIPGVP